jgi:hypothetical protein
VTLVTLAACGGGDQPASSTDDGSDQPAASEEGASNEPTPRDMDDEYVAGSDGTEGSDFAFGRTMPLTQTARLRSARARLRSVRGDRRPSRDRQGR